MASAEDDHSPLTGSQGKCRRTRSFEERLIWVASYPKPHVFNILPIIAPESIFCKTHSTASLDSIRPGEGGAVGYESVNIVPKRDFSSWCLNPSFASSLSRIKRLTQHNPLARGDAGKLHN